MQLKKLGLTSKDMIDQARADQFNEWAKAWLKEGDREDGTAVPAELTIDRVISACNMTLVDQTDPVDTDGGYIQLYKLPDGKHTTVWFVSSHGTAGSVFTAQQYDNDAVGFDNQPLGWSETE